MTIKNPWGYNAILAVADCHGDELASAPDRYRIED